MQYQVTAFHRDKGLVRIQIDAVSEGDALASARSEGLSVVSVRSSKLSILRSPRGGLNTDLFTEELGALLEAGLGLIESIRALSAKQTRAADRQIVERISRILEEGRPLSDALAAFPEAFPALLVSLIRASERTGHVEEAIRRYRAYRTRVVQIQRQVINATIYPALLLFVGAAVSLFLMLYVVPRLSVVYADLGQDLPLGSRLLMGWGQLLAQHGTAVLVAALAAGATIVYWFMRRDLRQKTLDYLSSLSAIAPRLHTYRLSRFYRVVGMLLNGGLPLTRALEMASTVLPAALRPRVDEAARMVSEGQAVTASLSAAGLTTEISMRLLHAGERAGRLGDMMDRAAVFCEDETERWLSYLTRLAEPMLMVVIGFFVGGIILLMYMPIFELAGAMR